MKKIIALILCAALCLGLMPAVLAEGVEGGHDNGNNGNGDGGAGVFEGLDSGGDKNYVIATDVVITADDSIILNEGTITIETGATLTIEAGGRLELQGMEITNEGIINVNNEGHLEIRDGEDNPGLLTNNGELTISGQTEIVDGAELANSENGTITINGRLEIRNGARLNNDDTINVNNDGCLEIRDDGKLLNNDDGTITVSGCLEIWDDEDNPGLLTNNGKLIIDGQARIANGAELANNENGTITVNGYLEIQNDAELFNNDGGTIEVGGRLCFVGGVMDNYGTVTGGGHGKIELDNSSVIGLYFYENTEEDKGIENPDGVFRYDNEHNKWIQDNDDDDPGPGEEPGDPIDFKIYIEVTGNGSVSCGDLIMSANTSPDSINTTNQETIIIQPESGHRVSKISVIIDDFEDDYSWNLEYEKAGGSYTFSLEDFDGDFTLKISFSLIDEDELKGLLSQNYAVLKSEADNEDGIKASLVNQFGDNGYVLKQEKISVSNILIDGVGKGYGTFSFKVTLGEENPASATLQTGYIVEKENDVVFKRTPNSGENVEIYVVKDVPGEEHSSDTSNVIEIPAWKDGTLEIFGYGNLMAMPLTSGVADEDGRIELPFNVAQFHVTSFYSGFNSYGLYIMQANALCVQVAARSGAGDEQRAIPWDLNRYADLIHDSHTSYVFFGNDKFTLSLPPEGVGAIESIALEIGEFGGYEVEKGDDGAYTVKFLSNFYDDISLDLTLTIKNEDDTEGRTEERTLNIRRVGVHIEPYEYNEVSSVSQVFHGTQFSSKIEFTEKNHYQIYGTYYIPGDGTTAPKLYVTYTWKNGDITAEIKDVLNRPAINANAEYENGVFLYNKTGKWANACDYLLYSGTKANAPVEVNVIVLKDGIDPEDDFDGVTFGSGRGVTWNKK